MTEYRTPQAPSPFRTAPDTVSQRSVTGKAIFIFVIVFAAYFFLRSPGLDEIDSVNFAMGVRKFDLWSHQPHPPGYPLFIFLGWIATKIFSMTPETSLHLVSAFGGAVLIAAWFLIVRLQFSERLAWWVAGCLAITPVVWMTATKVFSDTLAAGFLSAEIFAALLFVQRKGPTYLLVASLFGAAAAGARPQMIPMVAIILFVALRQAKANRQLWFLSWGALFAGCLVWILPTWYIQARLQPDFPAWLVYPSLLYGQWKWRFGRPHTFIGAGDWSLRYLGTRFAEHILGWLGLGFGFIRSWIALAVGGSIMFLGIGAYLFRNKESRDRQFWKFHAPWSLLHTAIIFACLDGTQRYYLPIFPLLLVVVIRGTLRMRRPYNWIAAALPVLLFYITIPAALQNHWQESPGARLAHWLQQLYPASRRQSVAFYSDHARRYVEWYAPEFQTFPELPATELPRILADKAAVYTDDPKLPLPTGWHCVPIATFKRSALIHVKDHTLTLYLIDRHS